MIDWLPNGDGYILHEHALNFHAQGTGWLSVKSFFGGAAQYNVGRGCYMVDNTAYLILNHGQSYTVAIDSAQPVESFCVFFAPALIESVYLSHTTLLKAALDSPTTRSSQAPPFVERTYTHDTVFSPALLQLRHSYLHGHPPQAWLIEQFHFLLTRLLRVQALTQAEIDSLTAAHPTTRDEIYRRVYRAKDYADALFATPITLDELAGVAALSPNHLLRTFKQVFQQTPYQYLTEKRLAHAQHLLRHTALPVTEICFAIGFESPSSFSGLFRRRFGLSPQAYRQQTW